MTGRFVLTPRARADLDEIWDYTADRWGPDQAESYIRQLWKAITAVPDSPALGKECAEVRRGYRKYPAGSHVLFYRLAPSYGIDVVRILHERMDYERLIP
jgi:toxin ParE1/3/4